MKTQVFQKKMLTAITKVLKDHQVPLARAQEMAAEALRLCQSNPTDVSSSALSQVRERFPELSV